MSFMKFTRTKLLLAWSEFTAGTYSLMSCRACHSGWFKIQPKDTWNGHRWRTS